MTAVDRLMQFIDYKGFNQAKKGKSILEFYKQTGLPIGSFKGVVSIGSENLKKIALKYPELNITWVVTGKGEMLVKETSLQVVNEPQEPYGINYREKYFEVLEKYNECLESKQKSKL